MRMDKVKTWLKRWTTTADPTKNVCLCLFLPWGLEFQEDQGVPDIIVFDCAPSQTPQGSRWCNIRWSEMQGSRDTALTHHHIKSVASWHTCRADCIKQLGKTTQTHSGCRLGHVQHLDSNQQSYINLKGSLWLSGLIITFWRILNEVITVLQYKKIYMQDKM